MRILIAEDDVTSLSEPGDLVQGLEAGAVCHELNQPLQVVSGFSEMLLLETNENDKNYETLKTIKVKPVVTICEIPHIPG